MPETDIRICLHEIDIITPCAELCTVTARTVKCPVIKLDDLYRNLRRQTERKKVTLL